MRLKPLFATLLAAAFAMPASALELAADGQWQTFDVDDLLSTNGGLGWIDLDGSPLEFSFTLTGAAVLRVVDAGFGGDRFSIVNQAGLSPVVLGETSTVATPDVATATTVVDFDLAFSDHDTFSFAEFALAPGSYAITGMLTQSAIFDGSPINATLGGIQLTAVPLPASGLLLLGASGLFGAVTRRRCV